MAYSSRKSSVPNGLVVLSTPVVAKKYAGKFAALIVSMDVTGSTKTSHESIQEQFRTLCQTVAIEFDAFKEQVLVRGEFVSGGLWPGILQSIDRVEMPECDFGGSSPLIDAEIESWKLLAADCQTISEQAALVSVTRLIVSEFKDTSTGARAPKIAELRELQNQFPHVQIVLVAPDDGYDPVVAKIFQREGNDTPPILLADAMSGGAKLFELLAEQLRSASRSVSNVAIRPGFRLKK